MFGMSYTTWALLVLLGGISCLLARKVINAVRASRRFAGVRLVTCPETGETEAVRFDRAHAALAAVSNHEPEAKLSYCSRWADRGPCEQRCVLQALRPQTAVATLMTTWSEHRTCAMCGGSLSEDVRVGHHITLGACDGVTTEWPQVAPETLPQALQTALPVCWNCHIAETFRRQHPELVTDR